MSKWDTKLKELKLCYRVNKSRIERKIQDSFAIINEALHGHEAPHVAFSGGKDSMLMLHLVQQIRPGTPALWSDDWDVPETWRMLDEVERLYNIKVWRIRHQDHGEYYQHYGRQPVLNQETRIDIECDTHSEAVEQLGFDLVFVGMRRDESVTRSIALAKSQNQYLKGAGIFRSAPIANWSLMDTWAYTAYHELPYHQHYADMVNLGVDLKYARVGGLTIVRVLNYGSLEMHKRLSPNEFNAMIAANPWMARDR